MKTVHGACPHDCPDTCAWLITVDDDGRAIKFEGDPDHPFTQGALCSKLKRYPDRVYSNKRVLHPLRRTGAKGSGEFERISWDTALDEMVGRLQETVARSGPLAAMPYNFAGTCGMLQRYAGEQFFARLGATEMLGDICGATAYDAAASVIGPMDAMQVEDLQHSKFIILWSTNTAVTNVHLWSGPIMTARKAGAQIVVIDPVKTPTAAHADWHIQVRPGTDAALALAMMHVIVREDLHDKEFIEQHTLGFDKLRERVKEYPPERAAAITGIPAAEIEKLARAYATTRPSAIRTVVGMERYSNGHTAMRAVTCLPGLIGGWRERGGGLSSFMLSMFVEALDYGVMNPPKETAQRQRSVHLAELGRLLTDPKMDPPIEWMMVYNSNPVVTAANQNLTIKGMKREDLFTVVHEQFLTDTALYADIVLPATTQFEHLDLMPSWGTSYIALNPPAIEPQGEAIANTELFRRLSKRMGFTEEYLHLDDEERIRRMLGTGHKYLDGISYERLEKDGWAPLNIGDYRPLAEGKFATPSGKCEFYSQDYADAGQDPLPTYEPLDEHEYGDGHATPLHLVSAKTSHFLNSEYVNLRHPGTLNHEPEVEINPADAAERDIASGDMVRLFNRYGEVEVRASVSDITAAGVVYLPFNWWPETTANGQSANALTPDGVSRRDIGSNAFDAQVEIKKAG
jgi:anaerobic selenocysteine-containing dehydrogenase